MKLKSVLSCLIAAAFASPCNVTHAHPASAVNLLPYIGSRQISVQNLIPIGQEVIIYVDGNIYELIQERSFQLGARGYIERPACPNVLPDGTIVRRTMVQFFTWND